MSPPAGAPRGVDLVGVVVPVHDEADLLARCLTALSASTARVGAGRDAPTVRVVVVLDRCTDGSAAIASRAEVEVLTAQAGTVGRARSLGAAHLLKDHPPERVWLASTDADSAVPPEWLAHHLAVARSGAGMLLGTVTADPEDLGVAHHGAWSATYRGRDGHGHVHGANLGIRGDAYLACGGFPALAAHEDVWLARFADALGYRLVRSAAHAVVTSGRLHGRAPDGFAAFLAGLRA
jgi:glycosyltransferase involved in cell wall biosynthesis